MTLPNYKSGYIGFYGVIVHYTEPNWSTIKAGELAFRMKMAFRIGDYQQARYFANLIATRN